MFFLLELSKKNAPTYGRKEWISLININIRAVGNEFLYSLEMEDKSTIMFLFSKSSIEDLEKVPFPDIKKFLKQYNKNGIILLGHLIYFVGNESISVVKVHEILSNHTSYATFKVSPKGVSLIKLPQETSEIIEIIISVLEEKSVLISH